MALSRAANTRADLRRVDLHQPIDPTSPLARDLEALWLPLPSTSGGERLYDLSGRGRHGTLTLMDPTVDWTTRVGTSWPVLRFDPNDSQDQRVQVSPVPTYDGGSVTFYARVWADAFGTTADNASRTQIIHHTDSSGNSFAIFAESDGSLRWHFFDGNSARGLTGSHQLSTGKWLDIVCAYDDSASDWAAWVNGTEVERVTDSVSFTVDGANFYIGNHTGKQRTWDGWIAAVGVFFRASTLRSTSSLHDQARRGFPDLLNRRDESSLYVSGTSAISLTTDELRHAHTLDPTSVSARYALTTNELQQAHALGASGLSVGYSLTTTEMQQAHTLESPSLAIAGLLTPEDVQHGHTLEDTLTGVQFALTTDALQQSHTLETSGVDVAYALTPQGLQHLHSLAPSTLEAIFGLTPEDLSQAHTIESPSGSALVILAVDGMTHPHNLGQVTLGTVGFATKIDVSASPLYDTDTDVNTLYQITLNAEPILE